MLEALLLMALPATADPLAEARGPTKPSLELLEFLGEFGDDETGVFDDETVPPGARAPADAADRRAPRTPVKAPPRKPSSPTTPPTKEPA